MTDEINFIYLFVSSVNKGDKKRYPVQINKLLPLVFLDIMGTEPSHMAAEFFVLLESNAENIKDGYVWPCFILFLQFVTYGMYMARATAIMTQNMKAFNNNCSMLLKW